MSGNVHKFLVSSLPTTVLLLWMGCAKSPGPCKADMGIADYREQPLTKLVDARGRSIALEKPAARIVSLLPSLTEYLFELDQGHRLVGRTNWCRFPAEAQSIEVVGGLENPVIETVLAIKPDVILAGPFLRDEQVDHLESLKLKVVTFDHQNWETIVRDLKLLGKIIGQEGDVKTLLCWMDRKRQSLVGELNKLFDRKSIKTLVLYSLEPLYSCGANTYIDELIKLAGGQNVAADSSSRWPMLSLESVLAKQPEVLLVSTEGGNLDELIIKIRQLPKDPIWGQLDAVENNRIYLLDGDTLAVAGPRIFAALNQIAAALHPEIFDAPAELVHVDLEDEA